MQKLIKLKKGDKVAILSPSAAIPGIFPKVFEFGLQRIKYIFGLEPVEFPTTRQLNASAEDRIKDLITAFKDPTIKAVIASIGGDDQVTFINKLPIEPFKNNPKPFFGFSDNTHFMNFLWLNNIPSYYGASVMTQFAMQNSMDKYTIQYIKHAMFDNKTQELTASAEYNDIKLSWEDIENLKKRRTYEKNPGWFWDGNKNATGITWGGCLESIDELLRHNITLPSLEQFENIILFTETSEEMPNSNQVMRVYKTLGERGIISRIKGLLVGRPQAWEFGKEFNAKEKEAYKQKQRKTILEIVRKYNPDIPIIQNMDFGHTDPQIPLPYGGKVNIDSKNKKIFTEF